MIEQIKHGPWDFNNMPGHTSDFDLRVHIRSALAELEAARPTPGSDIARRLAAILHELKALLESVTP